MITLNPLHYACAGDPETISKSIKGTEKTVLAFKTMAMGRIPPEEAIQLTLSCIKDTDFMVVGMTIPEEIEENVELFKKYTA
jgi:hypothetical protein